MARFVSLVRLRAALGYGCGPVFACIGPESGRKIIRDDQETDPQRRYKMVFESEYEGGEMGAYYTWSADGGTTSD